ncbi:AAA domain-containing protein [Mycoplasma tauri]|uniref:AAA domain-containing protein n=1 Tax=Mycoplasma tauri TaxID=547987 RepID=UPI001CBD381B|nr:DEAD/DEAH box helicase [Mycoplasma tauri]MBZ4218428.1 DNA2/NAM7 family helicase [Mycoplasma tauri]
MDIKSNKNKQYQTILNNLLDVSPTDYAAFTRVNNKYSFDFYSLFGKEAFDTIYSNKNFDIPILELNLINLCSKLENIYEYDELVKLLAENNFEITTNRDSQLKKNFAETKEKIISEIKANFQRQSLKWKLFLNKANEINTETNIWPMHLGFLFVHVNIGDKAIYAPLFFKEVYIEIRNASPYLISNGDIKPNEKLLFLLNNAGFDLEIDENYGDWTIKQLVKHAHDVWGQIYQLDINLNCPFLNKDAEEIKNESLEFSGGAVLGLFQPSGGYVRNRMLEIINNNELNKIIEVEFNKNIYKNRIKETLFNPKTSIFKITPTNFSQDKAIASSLNQNTIIWGPPGTGKSQTIVNILTNLLVYGKNSLVCSQKKAALEVIRNRMGMLKMFCLFMLNSKNMNKKSFYLPIKEYLSYLENFDEQEKLKPLRVISSSELNFINKIDTFCAEDRFKTASKVIAQISSTWESFTLEFWKKLISLPRDIKYPKTFNFEHSAELKKYMLKINNMRFKIHKPLNWKIKKIAFELFKDFKHYQGDLNKILPTLNNLTDNDYQYIHDLISILPKSDSEISDEIELKKFITKNIINKINQFDVEEKAEYTEFAASVRLATLEPYKFMKRFADIIKKIFPIIIVTPEADLSAWKKAEFDYSILDESSQIFLEKGLPVLYLSKIKILAGDDQQMKPSNWFGVRVTDEESIYGKVDSLLDFAKSLGVYNVLLDKNYRSNYASLMTFSSKYYYNSTLDVIDSANTEPNFNPIEVYEVNGIWENSQNATEAKFAIDLCNKNLKKYNKIILLCFNAKQQDYITKLIFKSEPELEKAIENGNLLLRNIENIQGDEADLVIVSVAYDYNVAIHSTYVGRPGGMNALNVAISRAKDKMIVIKSLKADDLAILSGNEDAIIFKKWLQFLELSNKEKQEFLSIDKEEKINEKINKTDLREEIENAIKTHIVNKPHLYLKENQSIGTINIDYVLMRNNSPVLCVIVDDYLYKNNPEKYIELKDLCKFVRSKKYVLYCLDRITWEAKKQEILDLVDTYKEINNSDLLSQTLDIPTTQLEIMDKTEEIIISNDYKNDGKILPFITNNIYNSQTIDTQADSQREDIKIDESRALVKIDKNNEITIILDIE